MKLYVAVLCLLVGGQSFGQQEVSDGSSSSSRSSIEREARAALRRELQQTAIRKAAELANQTGEYEELDRAKLGAANIIPTPQSMSAMAYIRKHPHAYSEALHDALPSYLRKDPVPYFKYVLIEIFKSADPKELKDYETPEGRSKNYVGFYSEHYGQPNSSALLVLPKGQTFTPSHGDTRLLTLSQLGDGGSPEKPNGQLFVGFKDQNGHGLKIDRARLQSIVDEEIQYLSRQYRVISIKKADCCSIDEPGIGAVLRARFDQLEVIRDLLAGKSSSTEIPSLDLYWTIVQLDQMKSTSHIDSDLDSRQLKEFHEQQMKQSDAFLELKEKVERHQNPVDYVPAVPRPQLKKSE